VSTFDYDGDGRLDVLVRNYRQPAQLLRGVRGQGHWVRVKLVGTRSNRDAIGARITVAAGGIRQTREVNAGSGFLSQSSRIQHFGLGALLRVDTIHVRWPSGAETRLTGVAGDRVVTIEEEAPTGPGGPS
jgi:hypothetical protein